MFKIKLVEEIKTRILWSVTVQFIRQCGGGREATDGNMAALYILDWQGYTRASTCQRPCTHAYTHARTHKHTRTQKYERQIFYSNSVTVYVHCVSCCVW